MVRVDTEIRMFRKLFSERKSGRLMLMTSTSADNATKIAFIDTKETTRERMEGDSRVAWLAMLRSRDISLRVGGIFSLGCVLAAQNASGPAGAHDEDASATPSSSAFRMRS